MDKKQQQLHDEAEMFCLKARAACENENLPLAVAFLKLAEQRKEELFRSLGLCTEDKD